MDIFRALVSNQKAATFLGDMSYMQAWSMTQKYKTSLLAAQDVKGLCIGNTMHSMSDMLVLGNDKLPEFICLMFAALSVGDVFLTSMPISDITMLSELATFTLAGMKLTCTRSIESSQSTRADRLTFNCNAMTKGNSCKADLHTYCNGQRHATPFRDILNRSSQLTMCERVVVGNVDSDTIDILMLPFVRNVGKIMIIRQMSATEMLCMQQILSYNIHPSVGVCNASDSTLQNIVGWGEVVIIKLFITFVQRFYEGTPGNARALSAKRWWACVMRILQCHKWNHIYI